jgi:hypothetical protein
MVFPQRGYRELNNDNHSHTMKEWCDMVNGSYEYCKRFNQWKWFVLWFYLKTGRVKCVNLPSHHPYWRHHVYVGKEKSLFSLISRYTQTKENEYLFKVLFGVNISRKSIEMEIKTRTAEINEFKKEDGFFKNYVMNKIKE